MFRSPILFGVIEIQKIKSDFYFGNIHINITVILYFFLNEMGDRKKNFHCHGEMRFPSLRRLLEGRIGQTGLFEFSEQLNRLSDGGD